MNHYSQGAVLATDLVNTYDLFAREEQLESVETLADFAANHGFDTANVTTTDLKQLRAARTSLRSAMLSNNQEEAVTALNGLLATAQPSPRLVTSPDGGWIFTFFQVVILQVKPFQSSSGVGPSRSAVSHSPDRRPHNGRNISKNNILHDLSVRL